MPSIDPTTSLARLVEENPARARVLEGRNLDFCCGGDVSLSEACDKRDLDVTAIREELETVDARDDAAEAVDFESLTELVDYIVDHHHAYLREELGPLGDLVQKVQRVHGDGHPELHDVADAFTELAREIPVHLSEEEQVVFPAVRNLEDGQATAAELEAAEQILDSLVDDHDQTAEKLERIHDKTDGYQVPDDACPSYENMLARLEQLERDLHMHVHRENHILFRELEQRLN